MVGGGGRASKPLRDLATPQRNAPSGGERRPDDRLISNGVGVNHVDEGRIAEVCMFHEGQYAFDTFYS